MLVNKKYLSALVIESGKFAHAMKEVFELLWEKTKGEYWEPKNIKLA